MTNPLAIRKAELGDLDALHEIIHHAYRTDKSWTGESHLVRGIRITKEDLRLLICESKDHFFTAGIFSLTN